MFLLPKDECPPPPQTDNSALPEEKEMERLAKEGVRRIAVVTPGFSADCLETLEEIAQENAEIFKHNGGEQFSAIPCLNDSDPGMDVIRTLVLRELQGWI